MRWLSDQTLDHLRTLADWPERIADRYRVLEPIGQGGMGTVYLAEDVTLNRQVALKVLREGVADASAAARMLREARVIARLEHPGIVPIHDVGQLPDGRTFYVMKLVRGRRLDDAFGPPLDGESEAAGSRAERLRVFERICETVAFAHAHGVIHRDLKPQNIMVGEFGEVLVLDWGVAKVLTPAGTGESRTTDEISPRPSGPGNANHDAAVVEPRDSARTRTERTARGTVVGTPAYMPPEQARGEQERVDQRSDVYALGAVLHYLLLGRPPQRAADTPGDAGRPPSAEGAIECGRSVPRPLLAICRKALAAEPEERYGGVAELLSDVSSFRAGQAVRAYRESWGERIGRVTWKYRAPILLVIAYLVMRAALVFFDVGR